MAAIKRKYCRRCKQHVVAQQQPKPGVGANLAMVIFTCGLWLPIFLLVLVLPHEYRCPTCGRRV